HRLEQAVGVLVRVRGHTAYAHQAVRHRRSEHGVCVNPFAHQLPEELANLHFIIDDDRYYGSESVEQLEAEPYEFASQRRAQIAKALPAFGLAFDYFNRLKDCGSVCRSQRRRVDECAAVMLDEFDNVA